MEMMENAPNVSLLQSWMQTRIASVAPFRIAPGAPVLQFVLVATIHSLLFQEVVYPELDIIHAQCCSNMVVSQSRYKIGLKDPCLH